MSGVIIIEFKDKVKVTVKPSSPKTRITNYSPLKIDIAAKPDKGKANKELIKFLSKLTKKKVSIISGSKSRHKLIKFS